MMSNIKVYARFRPLSVKERSFNGEASCVQQVDKECCIIKVEKEDDVAFCFDRVFYEDSGQVEIYDVLARPVVEDAVNGMNGTIITYGQTGAGKTYSMEGLGILDGNECNRGLLARVLDGIFELRSSAKTSNCTVNLSMVEIYMEKVRDLLDLSKENLQIVESKNQGIMLCGATQISIANTLEALQCLSDGIANRALGETNMNLSSSRSHCLYILSVQQGSTKDGRFEEAIVNSHGRVLAKCGKIILVDLAGSEKVEKTGATGKLLEEAKAINKSLSALGNVVHALTTGKVNHIPYRDSKLTRILQDTLGGYSRTALLCCCSPSSSNAAESLSTLRFGTRAKLIKSPPRKPNASGAKEKTEEVDASDEKDDLDEAVIKTQDEDSEHSRLLDKEHNSNDTDSADDAMSPLNSSAVKIVSENQSVPSETNEREEELMMKIAALRYKLATEQQSMAISYNSHINLLMVLTFFGALNILLLLFQFYAMRN